MRRHSVRIRLNDAELTLLDEAAAQAGLNRSGLVRALIAGGSDAGTATRREALALLATAARGRQRTGGDRAGKGASSRR